MEYERNVAPMTSRSLMIANTTMKSTMMAAIPKPSFDSLIDKTLLKIEVLIMSLAFTFALIGNLMVIFTLMFRRYVKKHFNSAHNTNSNANNTNTNNYMSYVSGAGLSSSSHAGHHAVYTSKPAKRPYRNKFTRMNFFILNLSIADVYVSLGNILTMLLWRMNNNLFYGGDLACRAVAYFQLVSVYYSTYVLITMTIDRYEAICKPLIGLGWSKTRGFVYICIAFCLSHLQGLPQLIFFSLRDVVEVEPPVKTCYARFDPIWLQSSYILYTFVMQFLIPLAIIIGCYASISLRVLDSIKNKSRGSEDAGRKSTFRRVDSATPSTMDMNRMSTSTSTGNERLRLVDDHDISTDGARGSGDGVKQHLQVTLTNNRLPIKKKSTILSSYSLNKSPSAVFNYNNNDELRQHCAKNFSRSKMKTIKLTLTVIVMYIICSTPYFVGMLLNLLLDSSKVGIALKYFMVLSCLLFQLNSCVNPWYVFFGYRSFM